MKWISLPIKVAVLMILAACLVATAGYLTYRSLSSIVASVEVKSRPDFRLLMIRDIEADLDQAESSVRLYSLTRDRKDIVPYYDIISAIDEKIDSLTAASSKDTAFLAQIDTISSLIEENLLVWNEMIDLYHSDSLETYIHSLTAKIAVGNLTKKKPGILKRVFSRKALKEEERLAREKEQQELISDINKIQQQDSIENSLLLAKESRLALTNDEIRERLYLLIARMENDVIRSIKNNSITARQMADQTYQRLIAFAVLGSLLVLTVLIVVVRYVLKIREYQVALERSKEETEKLSQTRERFVANMSHEIRTPVNAIFGFAGQLLHEKLSDRNRKMLRIIHSTAEHLVHIVNEVLDFSKLQNHALIPDKHHFALQPVFEETKMLLLPQSNENNTVLSYSISSDTPQVLFGDAYRLRQILLNLAGNAVKFTVGGEVRFSAESHNFSGTTFELVLTVTDTGIGISKEMHEKVFDDFTQAEAGITRKYGGTGLGLSIVKKLVEVHKGTIQLESQEGTGTTITCRLPYESGNPNLVRSFSENLRIPDEIRNMRVLVVDDEEYNRLLFRTIFTRWKVASDEVPDGIQALEKIKSGSYDMVFMDARMPGLSGLEASATIRVKLGIDGYRLPIIGTSATHSPDDNQLYHSAGMNAFLPKPFTERMLFETILSVKNHSETDGTLEEMPFEFIETELNEGTSLAPENVRGAWEPGSEGAKERVSEVNLKNLYHIAGNDVTFVRQMLVSFIQSTEKGLHGLDDSLKAGDVKSVHEIAHKISSPCRHVGAERLYSNLKMLEEQSKNQQNMGILADLTKDIKTEFLIIKQGLQNHLNKL